MGPTQTNFRKVKLLNLLVLEERESGWPGGQVLSPKFYQLLCG